MAQIGAAGGTAALGLTFATGGLGLGLIGMAVVAGAGVLDSQFLYPKLLGDGRQQGRPTPLVGLPTTTATSGTPRVWAFGRRVRVPLHVMFQADKVREDNVGGRKGGVANTIKRVFADCALSVNDRPTFRLLQLAANGQLVWWTDRNLVSVTTDQMTSSVVSSRLVLEMNSNFETDFADVFEVGDSVKLVGFSSDPSGSHVGTGTNAGLSYWNVYDVTPHGANSSTITLEPLSGQNMGTLVSVTAGSALFPGSVTRVDSEFVANSYTCAVEPSVTGANTNDFWLQLSEQQDAAIRRTTNNQGGWVPITLTNFQYDTGSGWTTLAANTGAEIARPVGPNVALRLWRVRQRGGTFPWSAGDLVRPNTGSLGGLIRLASDPGYLSGMFAASPSLSFYTGAAGSDPQGATAELRGQVEDDIIARHKTSGEIPGFRGLAYQVLDQWDLSTYFGNQLPPIIEGIVEPDAGMSVPQALTTVLLRSGIDEAQIDVSDVPETAFLGAYIQGAVPTTTALQPLLTAYQILVQERGNQLALFSFENADAVQIENGAAFSDLGVRSGAGTPNTGDKLRFTQADPADLPKSIGIRHQDPDVQFAVGYQHFAQRQPSGSPSDAEQDIDLSNLALPKKEARNLCGTIMRRTWVNGTAVELQLPVAYLEVLENDLLTVTDDEGNDHTVRVIQREVGLNMVVSIKAVVEDVALAVRGSPIQTGGEVPTPIVQSLEPVARVLDIPGLIDAETDVPGYYVGASSPNFGVWNGAIVYESRDAGTNWSRVAVLEQQVGCGLTTTALSTTSTVAEDSSGGPYYDTVNDVTFTLDGYGPLAQMLTVTEAEVEAGWNWVHIDDGTSWEIFGFRDVTDNGDGTWTVSHLLRGLRGTQDSARNSTKAAGASITLLFLAQQQGALQFIPVNGSAADLPVSIEVKIVAPGQTLADVDAVAVDVEGWNARPFPPFSVTVDRGGSPFDAVLNVLPWSRRNNPVGALSGWALEDAQLSLELDIYDPTGTTLQRTKTYTAPIGTDLVGVDFPYPASEQTADGYTPSGTETFIVVARQVGDYGDGRTRVQEVP
mgnify:FL=1